MSEPGQHRAQPGGQFDGGGHRQRGAGQDAGGDGPDEVGERLAFGEPDRDRQRPVAEDVALGAQAGDVLGRAELLGPGEGVGGQGTLQRFEARRRPATPLRRVHEPAHARGCEPPRLPRGAVPCWPC